MEDPAHMTRRPTWASLAAIGGAALLSATMVTTGLAQSAPAPTAYPDPVAQPPAPTADVASYPNYGGGVDCANGTFNGRPYAGNLKSIDAPDASTVVFTFCNPNVAFLAQAAFSSLAIDDAQYLIDHAADGTLLNNPNGTGPYKFGSWDLDQRIDLTANESYWGTKALTPNLEFQWNSDSAAKFLALTSGNVDGIDNPSKDDLPALEGDSNFQVKPREGTNTMYLGMNNTYKPWNNEKVRQAIAMGIDRQRLVDNFYPPGTEVADYFTPCSVDFACEGAKAPAFDATAAKALLLEGLAEEGIDIASLDIPVSYRPAPRSYISDPPGVAQDLVTQLQENLGLKAHTDEHENTTYLGESNAGSLEGLFILGWGMDFPDTSNFLTYHFGAGGGIKFGEQYPDLVAAITKGDQSVADADRAAAYATANDLIVQHAPVVIVSHAGSATAWKADVAGAHSSPLSTEIFSVMKAGDRDILVFMQGGQPGGLYCADETDGESLRVCEQIKESLYGYTVGGLGVVPSLAKECTGSEDLLTWTCTLNDGVTFHNGATLDASDVVVSYAAQWDALSPLHVGRTGAFEYWPALLGGGFLNPAGPCGLPNTAACK
jgi:peptide/nickel transport system substrate-binding protein